MALRAARAQADCLRTSFDGRLVNSRRARAKARFRARHEMPKAVAGEHSPVGPRRGGVQGAVVAGI
jgi:hypothetical protein